MKMPYTINIDYEQLNLNYQSLNIPNSCRYLLPFAKNRRLFKVSELQLFSQQVVHNPFFIDLIEIDVKETSYIPFDIHDRHLFMYFTLGGSLLYITENKKPIVRTFSF